MVWPRTGIIRMECNPEEFENLQIPPSPIPTPPPSPPSPGSSIPTPGSIDGILANSINFSNMVVQYFKINLESTVTNIYGEAPEKWYYPPALVKCLIERGVTTNINDDFGVDTTQTITISIPKQNVQVFNFAVEVGDIVSDRERYYEVNNVDTQFITIPGGGVPNSTTGTAGQVVLYVLTCHLTRVTRLNLIETYQ